MFTNNGILIFRWVKYELIETIARVDIDMIV